MAASNNSKNKKCTTCNKSSLSLLLLRPSPIANTELTPVGASKVKSDSSLYVGLVPVLPKKSRTVLRLLRAGYVYVYIPSPPKNVKQWTVYRVTDNADLIEEADPLFAQSTMPAVCTRKEHNAAGMRTISIPMAHEVDEIKLAYSANLWDEKLREANKSSMMQTIKLTAGKNDYAFKPTAENLESKVLESALPNLKVLGSTDTTYPFNPINADDMAKQLKRVAVFHEKTEDKELAVVLTDPVAYTAELNEIRVKRHSLLQAERFKPENEHPLNSLKTVQGIRQSMIQTDQLESFKKVAPIVRSDDFDNGDYPAGTEWVKASDEENAKWRKELDEDGYDSSILDHFDFKLGRVIYPDLATRQAEWAQEQADKSWEKLAPHYNQAASDAWLATFKSKMEAKHYKPLAAYEKDWLDAVVSLNIKQYFNYHFDENYTNDMGEFSSGICYSRESYSIHQPAPYSTNQLLDKYLALTDLSLNKPEAIIGRALVGNQKEVIDIVHEKLSADSGDGEGARDKSYDILKGLTSFETSGNVIKRYSWLADGITFFSVGQVSALSAAFGSAVGSKPLQQALKNGSIERWGNKINGLAYIQHTVDLANNEFNKAFEYFKLKRGPAPNVPLLITQRISIEEALKLQRAMANVDMGYSRSRLKKMRGNKRKPGKKPSRFITLTILTDTESVRKSQGKIENLIKQGDSVFSKADLHTGVKISKNQLLSIPGFMGLYAEQQMTLGQRAAGSTRQILETLKSSSLTKAMGSLDGRLAIGSVVVQSIGLYHALSTLLKEGASEAEIRDARYGLADSVAGLAAGMMEVMAEATKVMLASQTANKAAKDLLRGSAARISGLMFFSNVAGAFGGAINALAMYGKHRDAAAMGDFKLSQMYFSSALAFLGTGVTNGVLALGAGAEYIVAKQLGSRALQSVATGVAVRIGAGTAAAAIIPGVGWVFLLVGFGLQVAIIMLTPSPVQKWLSRSYFGLTPRSIIEWDGAPEGGKFPRGDWTTEQKALNELTAGMQ